MDVGDLRVDPVIDGVGQASAKLYFEGTTDDDWLPHRDLIDADGMLGMTIGGFVIRGPGYVALVDLGVGKRDFHGVQGGAFLDRLLALGVAPGDVTDVIFTHLHWDHIGWASTDDGEPVFEQATYRCATDDWRYFVTDNTGEPEMPPPSARSQYPLRTGKEIKILAPIADRFEFWDGSPTILPGVDLLATPGHTPGSTTVVVSSQGARAILLGDVAHCAVELVDEEWAGIGDVDPALAARTKAALIREFEGGDVPVAGAHFPGLQFGRLLTGEGRRRWIFEDDV